MNNPILSTGYDHNINPPESDDVMHWTNIKWPLAVTILSLSEDEDTRLQAAKRIYDDLGVEELGFDQPEWMVTFLDYEWDGTETLEDARAIFGGQK